MKKILNTIANFSESAKPILEKAGQVTYLVPTQKQLAKTLAGYDAVLVGLGLRFDEKVLAAAKKLNVIATATTGLDHLDLAAAEKLGIKILSLRGEEKFLNTITGTAELAFALMLNLMRRVLPAAESARRGEWRRENFRGHSLAGKTLGVIGVGRLGRMMVRYGRAFGMRVLGYDPHVDVTKHGAEASSFEKLVHRSDIISLHLHLAPETKNLFQREIFTKMKPAAFLINTSRGEIVNETDLLVALKTGQIAGYAADVLGDETRLGNRVGNHPLIKYAQKHDNCLIVPHIGGMTYESREATDIFISKKLARYLKNN